MTELGKEQKAVEGKSAKFNPVQDSMDERLFDAVGCEMPKKDAADNKSISDHAEIILDALNDYRRWFAGNDDSDKELTKQIDDAIKFVLCP